MAPWFDALFLANVAWPLLVLVQVGGGFAGSGGVAFWQLYYVTTPHRWITLAIVFLDRERFGRSRLTILGLAAAALAVCLGVRLTTGALTCLMTVDYLWNAWHFASQHHGIYRIYQRHEGAPPAHGDALEKWALRGFLLYVSLRVAGATWTDMTWEAWAGRVDWLAVLLPAWLLVRDLARPGGPGRRLYLVSVTTLYLSLLAAVHARRLDLMLGLATASALFHALEYLALVSWSVQARHKTLGDELGILGWLAPRWGLALGLFIALLGAGFWLLEQEWLELWLFLNVVAAFLHYAYDGLIWRRPPRL